LGIMLTFSIVVCLFDETNDDKNSKQVQHVNT
jgi:hypothetical protein